MIVKSLPGKLFLILRLNCILYYVGMCHNNSISKFNFNKIVFIYNTNYSHI